MSENMKSQGGMEFKAPETGEGNRKKEKDQRKSLSDLVEVPTLKRDSLSPDDYREIESYKPIEEGNVADMDNSLFNPDGKVLLTAPDQDLIATLHKMDSRIEYFHYQLPEKYKAQLDTNGKLPLKHIHGEGYKAMISDPLAHKIAEEFPDIKQLAIRSVSVSINGGIVDKNNSFAVRDIRHVLQDGNDQPQESNTILAARIQLDSKGIHQLHHRVDQFLHEGPSGIGFAIERKGTDSKSAEKVFPILLIYDLSKLKLGEGHIHVLPEDPKEREKIILRAIIVDKAN